MCMQLPNSWHKQTPKATHLPCYDCQTHYHHVRHDIHLPLYPRVRSCRHTQIDFHWSIVTKLPCVNDCAERGVALIEKFNSTTKDESQKQYLLQVVEQHRKTFCKRN